MIAVLDWELSTLGHPLADFAYQLMMYRAKPGGIAGLSGADLGVLNIPAEQEHLAMYCNAAQRDSIPERNFYLDFHLFRFAAILHGIKGRALRGNAASDNSKLLVAQLPFFAAAAWSLTE